MAEYIERDKALREIDHSLNLSEAYSKIAEMPAADVVEVVRCKDCKHFFYESECSRHSRSGSPITGYTFYTRPNDFCSYGERRDNTSDMETWSPEGQKLYDTLLARVKMDGGAE